jgi:hypothetical protein
LGLIDADADREDKEVAGPDTDAGDVVEDVTMVEVLLLVVAAIVDDTSALVILVARWTIEFALFGLELLPPPPVLPLPLALLEPATGPITPTLFPAAGTALEPWPVMVLRDEISFSSSRSNKTSALRRFCKLP